MQDCRSVKSHSGARGKHSHEAVEAPRHFCRAPLERNFVLEFSFSKWLFLVYFIFLSDSEAPNVVGPGVAYPLPHPLDGTDCMYVISAIFQKILFSKHLNMAVRNTCYPVLVRLAVIL